MGLTKEEVLRKNRVLELVSPLDIFEAFCPDRFTLNKPFSSPFRSDRNPSFVIKYKNGFFSFVDYGDSDYRGDCFNFVGKTVGATAFPDILEAIDTRMNLGIKSGKAVRISDGKKKQEALINIQDESKLIQVKAKRFTGDGARYWNEYHLSLDDLKKQKDVQTYMIDRFWINKKLHFINYDELVFGHFFNETYWKLYRPHAKEGEWKWISNVPFDLMYGLSNLNRDKSGVGNKSVKDLYVTAKLKEEVCGTQGENIAAINDENASYITKNCSKFFLFFDNDQPGIKASTQVCDIRNYKWVNNPGWMRKFNAKDPSGMVKEFGMEALEYHFKCKNIL